ncbi:MAG: radical SAM protein [Nanoarchaeota archaeon]|nr:radical SAM protein [Nanoarchaeota archaeon]
MKKRLASGIIKHYVFGKQIPLIITHIITYKCNLKCEYCGIWKQKIQELETSEIKKIIDFFAEKGTISWEIGGGEPLLRKDIGEIIDHAKSKKMLVSLNTNGHLFEKRIDSLKNLDSIVFSIDGTEKIHDKIKRKGSYKKTLQSLELARKKGFKTLISTVISKINYNHLEDVLKIAKEKGVKIGFQPVHVDAYNDKKMVLTEEEFMESKKTIENFMKKNPGIVHQSKNYLDLMHKILFRKKKIKCFAGKLFFNLLPDGNLTPCWFKQIRKINPLKQSLNKLKVENKCSCTPTCYLRYNSLFSLQPGEIIFFLKNFLEFL